MDTTFSRKLLRWADANRRFLFLGLGVVLGVFLVYGLPCTDDPKISAVIGVGLLAGAMTIKSRRGAEKDAEFSRR